MCTSVEVTFAERPLVDGFFVVVSLVFDNNRSIGTRTSWVSVRTLLFHSLYPQKSFIISLTRVAQATSTRIQKAVSPILRSIVRYIGISVVAEVVVIGYVGAKVSMADRAAL